MPSLFRFLFVVGALAGITVAGLYAVANYMQPAPREISHPVYGVKVDK